MHIEILVISLVASKAQPNFENQSNITVLALIFFTISVSKVTEKEGAYFVFS